MPTIRKRGRSSYLCWSEPGRPEQRKSLGVVSAAEAREAARAKRTELDRKRMRNIVDLPLGHMPTFAEFAQEYEHWHAQEYPDSTDRTASALDVHLVPYFGSTPLDRITKAQAERYKVARAQATPKPKAETVAKELRVLQAAMNRAVFMELLDRNQIKGIKPPASTDSKPPRFYTSDELQLIYAHSKPLPGDEQHKGKPINSGVSDYAPVWRLMANFGLRRAEALGLKWADVSADSIRILSTSSSRTKSGKWRQVPKSPGGIEALKMLWPVTGRGVYVLPRMHPNSLYRAFKRSAARAGLDGTEHCLRHTFCSHLVMAGIPLRTVQILAGHASIKTTEKYAHLGPDYLRDSVAGLLLRAVQVFG